MVKQSAEFSGIKAAIIATSPRVRPGIKALAIKASGDSLLLKQELDLFKVSVTNARKNYDRKNWVALKKELSNLDGYVKNILTYCAKLALKALIEDFETAKTWIREMRTAVEKIIKKEKSPADFAQDFENAFENHLKPGIAMNITVVNDFNKGYAIMTKADEFVKKIIEAVDSVQVPDRELIQGAAAALKELQKLPTLANYVDKIQEVIDCFYPRLFGLNVSFAGGLQDLARGLDKKQPIAGGFKLRLLWTNLREKLLTNNQ